jgi:RNA polymerase sigma factor (sigma-70 family)
MSNLALPIRSPPELPIGERLLSDERLAKLVSKGSARAFAVLYQRHHQALYRYCRSIVRNEEDAQDALQNAMMRALAALQRDQRDIAVRPWLFRIVHNEAVSLLRRRRPTASLTERFEPMDDGIESKIEQRERFAELRRDLQSLPERQRAALVMRELSGLSIQEIAAALSTTPGAAKQAIFEARSALADYQEGRAMECEAVRRAVSDGDGRILRARRLRAHLRDCQGCHDFQDMIGARTAELRALAPPLPAAAATTMLASVLSHGASGGHAGGIAAASGAALGKPAVVSLTMKALAGVAVVTAATAGTVHLVTGRGVHRPAAPPVVQRAHGSGGAQGLGTPAGSSAPLSAGTLGGPRAKAHRPTTARGLAAGGAAAILGGAAGRSGAEHGHRASSGTGALRAHQRHAPARAQHAPRSHSAPKSVRARPKRREGGTEKPRFGAGTAEPPVVSEALEPATTVAPGSEGKRIAAEKAGSP